MCPGSRHPVSTGAAPETCSRGAQPVGRIGLAGWFAARPHLAYGIIAPMQGGILGLLSEEDQIRLLQRSRRRAFKRGEVVYHRGDPADTVHLVYKGRFAAEISTPLGATAMLSVLGPGEVFGEVALLEEGSARSATITALEPAETRAIHRIDFDAARAQHPEVTEFLVAALAARVRRLTELLAEALYVPADVRVLRRLNELRDVYAGTTAGEVIIPLNQEQLAQLAGTSRATVNRVLREMQRGAGIELRRGKVVILDRDAVARRAR